MYNCIFIILIVFHSVVAVCVTAGGALSRGFHIAWLLSTELFHFSPFMLSILYTYIVYTCILYTYVCTYVMI